MSLIGEWGMPVIDDAGYARLLEESKVFSEAQELLQVRLAQDFLNLWAAMPDVEHARQVRYLTEALADLQLVYGQDAAALAAEYLTVIRQGADLPVVLAEPATVGRVGGSTRWAMSNPEAQSLLFGAMQRMALEPYRETIRLSAFEAGNGFARVPEPGACGFCLMLASRGAVYYSADEALQAGRARWSKSNRRDRSYHDNCKCTVTEVTRNSGVSEANVLLEKLWGETFYHDPETRLKPKNKQQSPAWMQAQWEAMIKETDLPWMSAKPITR